jgi:hypothetical protein
LPRQLDSRYQIIRDVASGQSPGTLCSRPRRKATQDLNVRIPARLGFEGKLQDWIAETAKTGYILNHITAISRLKNLTKFIDPGINRGNGEDWSQVMPNSIYLD